MAIDPVRLRAIIEQGKAEQKLSKCQRLACLCVMTAVCSTPTDAMKTLQETGDLDLPTAMPELKPIIQYEEWHEWITGPSILK